MTTFLLIISFLLHAISLFALILLFQRQNNMKHTEQKVKQAADQTEEMMAAFLMELKEENKRFVKEAAKKPAVTAEKRSYPAADPEEFVLPPIIPRKAAAQAYKTDKPEPKQEKASRSLVEKIVDMQKQGMTEEEIARKLQVGVTEIQLALKFNRTEEK